MPGTIFEFAIAKISAGTAKTIKMGAKTQTIKVGGPQDSGSGGGLPSDEEIRKLTGA